MEDSHFPATNLDYLLVISVHVNIKMLQTKKDTKQWLHKRGSQNTPHYCVLVKIPYKDELDWKLAFDSPQEHHKTLVSTKAPKLQGYYS